MHPMNFNGIHFHQFLNGLPEVPPKSRKRSLSMLNRFNPCMVIKGDGSPRDKRRSQGQNKQPSIQGRSGHMQNRFERTNPQILKNLDQ